MTARVYIVFAEPRTGVRQAVRAIRTTASEALDAACELARQQKDDSTAFAVYGIGCDSEFDLKTKELPLYAVVRSEAMVLNG